jgi:hypothetical protein
MTTPRCIEFNQNESVFVDYIGEIIVLQNDDVFFVDFRRLIRLLMIVSGEIFFEIGIVVVIVMGDCFIGLVRRGS